MRKAFLGVAMTVSCSGVLLQPCFGLEDYLSRTAAQSSLSPSEHLSLPTSAASRSNSNYSTDDKTNTELHTPGTISAETDRCYRAVLRLLVEGKYHEALPYCQKAIELDSASAFSCNMMGDIQTGLKDFPEAIEWYTRAINKPGSEEAHANISFSRSKAYVAMKEYKEAIEDIKAFLKSYPQASLAYSRRGFAYYNCKDYEQAIEDFTMYLSLSKESAPDILVERGDAYAKLNRHENAIEDFSQAINLIQDNRIVKIIMISRARSYRALGRIDKVREDLAAAKEIELSRK
ncbi:MAG: tetratricopeptide repeat protein [Cyanobacteria bacterium SZAS TMP-1]|nr:tetratricopeptide repeat protein [Cyanobacteria bacterium SZAS TMP-1]